MSDLKAIDAQCLIKPGAEAQLKGRDTRGDALFPDRAEAEKITQDNAKAIDDWQDKLFAERTRALLVVLQGVDTSGKDGTIRGVFGACGPLGVRVTPFGKPTEAELAQDYLWRVHAAVPPKGIIGIFNRSHYEDVLVVKVRKLAPEKAIAQRYEQINAFEKHLVENGVAILKFMLRISKDEQAERLQDRLEKPHKNWKFNPGDLEDRKLWDEYEAAYETMLAKCSTKHAPWRVIPADKKWRRNAIISTVVRETLEQMKPAYPKPAWKPGDYRIE